LRFDDFFFRLNIFHIVSLLNNNYPDDLVKVPALSHQASTICGSEVGKITPPPAFTKVDVSRPPST